jgi:3-oxoacyl-[acyl-carrier-protein] synthase-1
MGFKEKNTVCISALGMATALAPTLYDSCAAMRAGITRMSELSIVSLSDCESLGPIPIAGCTARYIAPGFIGLAKALQLGSTALFDFQSRRSLNSEELQRTGIFVNVSDQFYADINFNVDIEQDRRLPSAVWEGQCRQLISGLLRMNNMEIVPQNHRLYFGGHTGFVQAIEEAVSVISAGQFDRCLVGGIDSCIEPRFLIAAAAKGLLKTGMNPVGFIPGEAAAFVLLEHTEAIKSKEGSLAFLVGTSVISNLSNRLSDGVPDGVALAQVIDQVVSGWDLSEKPLVSVVGDLNGDEYRARDWGNALTRLSARHNFAEAVVLIPALAFGETGAASAAIGLCLGIVAQRRGRLPDGPIVEWLSADSGSRAALHFSSTVVA